MKNFLKQLEAWGTALKDDPFLRARLRLVVLNSAILIGFIGVSFFIFRYNYKLLFIIISAGTILMNYMFSAETLAPIRQIVRAQKRFIADSSHELRTPLSIIKINTDVALLEGKDLTTKEAVRTLESNLEEVDRMSKLIENLLKLSYYDAKPVEVPFSKIDLSKIVKDIVEKTNNIALTKNIRLSMSRAEPAPIWGNPTAIEQLAINLIRNAITYTPEGGRINVSVSNRNFGYCQLDVRDTGVGISEKDLPHIFNPFYKAEGGDGIRSKSSSGLGLTIVKKIAERHKAIIDVESAMDSGTVFHVRFPKFG
ncbi:MAG: ATPase/histidine kinase/DNA gyrase B/HSP90 domain protein [Candidatus Yanofskybacteria bacterium GW2011_GWA1_44_21]|uniref:histidine kinase n=2 Tax=Candidatus Yanofskyibacteriota TaxID=1752733 RepID=A0A1F8GZ83_9BACT|nr:MAG: ATPase/histidine kinase/DNA gyrase B/HSP90 domain protein [Candidatus Yanofskybacteria bacterium GW2011_GWA2_44_10]KKT50598.1 MAG: ATPase/histidine kinase/DNA gyrase B/HSP90 domain protein [Candidatus Yanofskybacteria bacterium GW2011_GWA1_44_21]KKT90112.1 MAG: ATPase/histidine kinase/DNA gyrase B/HSP90 domain protein [Candidatus Yanofskybacteria bacterium GW2011_GWB1_45_11]OGN02777.1 MAG: hypothetical protein A2657_01380 [Candidatus Yanofskybacteria bacterium RIFCSPHIGHO2_01_FULL_44_110